MTYSNTSNYLQCNTLTNNPLEIKNNQTKASITVKAQTKK